MSHVRVNCCDLISNEHIAKPTRSRVTIGARKRLSLVSLRYSVVSTVTGRLFERISKLRLMLLLFSVVIYRIANLATASPRFEHTAKYASSPPPQCLESPICDAASSCLSMLAQPKYQHWLMPRSISVKVSVRDALFDGIAYLGKSDILRFFPEALTADVQAIFPDEACFVGAHATVRHLSAGREKRDVKWRPDHALLPLPYVRGREYQTDS